MGFLAIPFALWRRQATVDLLQLLSKCCDGEENRSPGVEVAEVTSWVEAWRIISCIVYIYIYLHLVDFLWFSCRELYASPMDCLG